MTYIIKKNLYYPIPKKINRSLESLSEVKDNRQVTCLFYSSCLSHAVSFHWNGFSCKNCKDFIRDTNSNDDSDRCKNFIYTILYKDKNIKKFKLKRKDI